MTVSVGSLVREDPESADGLRMNPSLLDRSAGRLLLEEKWQFLETRKVHQDTTEIEEQDLLFLTSKHGRTDSMAV